MSTLAILHCDDGEIRFMQGDEEVDVQVKVGEIIGDEGVRIYLDDSVDEVTRVIRAVSGRITTYAFCLTLRMLASEHTRPGLAYLRQLWDFVFMYASVDEDLNKLARVAIEVCEREHSLSGWSIAFSCKDGILYFNQHPHQGYAVLKDEPTPRIAAAFSMYITKQRLRCALDLPDTVAPESFLSRALLLIYQHGESIPLGTLLFLRYDQGVTERYHCKSWDDTYDQIRCLAAVAGHKLKSVPLEEMLSESRPTEETEDVPMAQST